LIQDSDRHASAAALASALVHGPAGLWQRLRRRRSAVDATGGITSTEAGFDAAWLGSRLCRTLGDLCSPAVWQQSRDLARFSRWIGR
jgi:hypothetical protein